jgi:hypothetical protein
MRISRGLLLAARAMRSITFWPFAFTFIRSASWAQISAPSSTE